MVCGGGVVKVVVCGGVVVKVVVCDGGVVKAVVCGGVNRRHSQQNCFTSDSSCTVSEHFMLPPSVMAAIKRLSSALALLVRPLVK